MSEPTRDQLQAEVERLRGEIRRLREMPVVALTGTMAVGAGASGSSLTVTGAEEMILQVAADLTVGYVNRPMARLLGIPDRREAIGTPVARWDAGPIGPGVITGLVQVAVAADQPHVLERPCVGVPRDRLPDAGGARPADTALLRFVATGTGGRVEIVAQDVTRLRWLERTFSRYVSPAVIERLQGMPAVELLRMDRRELTVLFGDLRGFTALCQELPPEEVQEVVNSFLAGMVACIDELGGTIDKFVGDEVMAIFGAPVPQPDHALRALVCAVGMQQRHRAWMAERRSMERPAPPLGIGLATGSVVVGNVGTDSRMDFTVLGHTVNLAARLCGAAEGGEILTVPDTHARALGSLDSYSGAVPVPRLSFRSKGRRTFKNVAGEVEVVALSPGLRAG